jgi:hypothetical protein
MIQQFTGNRKTVCEMIIFLWQNPWFSAKTADFSKSIYANGYRCGIYTIPALRNADKLRCRLPGPDNPVTLANCHRTVCHFQKRRKPAREWQREMAGRAATDYSANCKLS